MFLIKAHKGFIAKSSKFLYAQDMKPQAFIIMGTQGSGKGTQMALLKEVLAQKTPDIKILQIDTGQGFRKLVSESSYTANRIKESLNKGERQPDALAIYIVMSKLIYEAETNQHFIIDGSPRTVFQAEALDTAFKFYGFEKPVVIVVNVTREEAKKRLMLRKRHDDTEEGIEKRLNWYQDEVVPAIDYYNQHPYYNVVEVNGEQSVEDVHKEILQKISLS
jgi:adenylate kinase